MYKNPNMSPQTFKIVEIRNQIAWTLLNSLINLDPHWFKTKTTDLFDLWTRVLTSNRQFKENNEKTLREINTKRYVIYAFFFRKYIYILINLFFFQYCLGS